MFTAKNYEEMAEIAKGNREREAVMKELQRLGSDPEFVDYYDHDEFEEINKRALERDAIAKGLEQGIEQGIQQGLEQGIQQGISQGIEQKQKDIIKKMFKSGMSITKIASILELSSSEIEKCLKQGKI